MNFIIEVVVTDKFHCTFKCKLPQLLITQIRNQESDNIPEYSIFEIKTYLLTDQLTHCYDK